MSSDEVYTYDDRLADLGYGPLISLSGAGLAALGSQATPCLTCGALITLDYFGDDDN